MERTEMQFVRAFGRLLLPRGFLLWNGGFYRIDAEEGLIWVVALDRPDDALCTVSYDVKAFCHGLNEAALRGGMYRVLGLRARYGAELRRMSEPEADAAVFRKLLLERFTQIGGLADLQAFRRWHYGLIGGTPGGENWLPLVGIMGAMAHIAGQMLTAVIIYGNIIVLAYTPILICSAVIGGAFTGTCTLFMLKKLDQRVLDDIRMTDIPTMPKFKGE